mmetsp:Transcript_103398/g.299063  ORF Transcript_103398/g.299063 Transcript_103398/m.299063 type:complete len:392 (+) Transcript_103398:507-1682(+)
MSVSFLATCATAPEPNSAATAFLFSAIKRKYALGGRLGSAGAASSPKNFTFAFATLALFSASPFNRKYFLPSGVFAHAWYSCSYCACKLLCCSKYGFWPSAPSCVHAGAAAFRAIFFSLMKRVMADVGRFGMLVGASGPFGAALPLALPLALALALALPDTRRPAAALMVKAPFGLASRLRTGILNALASATYCFHELCPMNSFDSALHLFVSSLKFASYGALALLDISFHCFKKAETCSPFFVAAPSSAGATTAARRSRTKIAKGDFGGAFGAPLRNLADMTLAAVVLNSFFAATSPFSNSLYSLDSFHVLSSTSYFSSKSLRCASNSRCSSSEASANFCFKVDNPALPASTSSLCFSAKSANTDGGLLGAHRKFNCLFSRSLTFKSSCK